MKAIKFVSSDNRQKQFAAAIRKNVYGYFKDKGISTKGNAAMVIQTGIMLYIYIIPFIV